MNRRFTCHVYLFEGKTSNCSVSGMTLALQVQAFVSLVLFFLTGFHFSLEQSRGQCPLDVPSPVRTIAERKRCSFAGVCFLAPRSGKLTLIRNRLLRTMSSEMILSGVAAPLSSKKAEFPRAKLLLHYFPAARKETTKICAPHSGLGS